jgi:hypothetical protein
MQQPAGEIAAATGAAGALSWEVAPGMYAPCSLDVDLSAQFAGAPAWAPAVDDLGATGVTVEGGCM